MRFALKARERLPNHFAERVILDSPKLKFLFSKSSFKFRIQEKNSMKN